VLAKVTKLFKL